MKNRNWFLLSLLLLMVAALLLRQGEQRRVRELSGASTNDAPVRPGLWERFTRLPDFLKGRKPAPVPAKVATGPSTAHITSLSDDRHFPFRVRNTQKKDAELFRSETAVLLRNALVETREPVRLNIPAHLRAQGDPGSWLVQARGTIDQKFRDVLRGAGVEIISYVPNNAFLVRANASLAQQLRVSPRVQSVLPFEPFYKLDMQLLPLAVRQEAMPTGRWLNLVLFSGTEESAKSELRALGAEVKSEQPFPFGHVVTIAPPAGSLVALAQMPAVQNIETYHSPIMMNDLSRVRLDVSVDTTTAAPAGNWLNLTGNGVVVGLIGSGLDTGHPELAGQYVLDAVNTGITDTNAGYYGHDTFVGGIIAALGASSPTSPNLPFGSIQNANFRGIASGAKLYPLSLFARDYTNYGNVWLITNSALATNTLTIVNNSWGYPVSTYDIASAQFDEAVRDALPFRPHDQPITHVFAAGNSGGANSGGTGGAADTIASPGNAKNVITVGASELLRFVTNSPNASTNVNYDPIPTAHSDSLNQVADFSSRGNVGVGIEGEAGRFKPDLVAPGAYVVSLRHSTYPGTNLLDADTSLGAASPGTYWRFDSGSSFAAAKVSGLLALMQEFFAVNFSRTNKPSLNKALLINRASSLGPAYDFAVNSSITHQGWGIPSLSNTVPSAAATTFGFLTNGALTGNIVIVDESSFITNHLASGQYHSFDVSVPASASQTNLLKITLAWTDPAGNPIASAKLVNDLDLYVTNLVASGQQFEGNNFAAGTTFTQDTPPGSESQRDSVNNVENTFIPLTNTAAATTFRVFVIGRKVNVNAVSGDGNNGTVTNVVQDYSLVISTDDPTRNVTVSPTAAAPPGFFGYTNRLVNMVTNGLPYLNERVGANSALFSTNGTANANTNGVTNQWNFYVFTNQNYTNAGGLVTNLTTNIVSGFTNVTTNVIRLPLTNGGPYVTFATFLPPNLARRRMTEADVDLYVTRSSLAYPGPSGAGGLTNLDPQVLSDPNTLRSTNRGGYELIYQTNSSIGEVFYIGIKSEDQQGGQYGFLASASQQPFGTNTTNGNLVITLFPAPMDIPDGSPETPGGIMLYGICTTNILLSSAHFAVTYAHENLGDLVGTVTHNGTNVTLNNHTITPLGGGTPAPGGLVTNSLLYDDFRNPPDGPGDVTDFIGQDAIGLWLFEVYDNAPFQTGRVDAAAIYMAPYTNASNPNRGTFIRTITLAAGQSFVDFLDVPGYATNLNVDILSAGLSGVPGPAPAGQGVDLLAGVPGLIPNSSNYSIGTLDLDSSDTYIPKLVISSVAGGNFTNNNPAAATTPSLTPGRWNFRVINNTAGTLTLTLQYTLGLDLSVATTELTYTNALISLLDNYTTNLFITAPQDRVIAGVDVGLAIKHPRVSDLVIHLISPNGTKVLLFEDRYGTNGVTTSNLYANFTENTNYSTHVDTNGYAALGFLDLGYLLPIKFVPAPFSAVVSPPRLFTNATNLTFGYDSRPPLGSYSDVLESPGGLAIQGQSLFMAGKVTRYLEGLTNDGFMVSYQIPIQTNRDTPPLLTVTNWAVTNFWTGPFSGYRGGNPAIPAVSRTPEQTFFSGVAANSDGVFAVGQTRNYFPPATVTWSGTNTRQAYDIDLGCTAGSVTLTHISDTIRDRVVMEYQGLAIMDFTPAAGAAGTNYITNLNFNGASRFMRVIVNPVVAAAVGSSWTNILTVHRTNGVEYAVTNFLPAAPADFILPPQTTPAYTYPTPTTNLSLPSGLALDTSNNLYVADTGHDRVLKFSQALTIQNSTILPPVSGTNGTYVPFTLGNADATHGAAMQILNKPVGVAVNPINGDIYVTDTGNNLVKRFDGAGLWLDTWGDRVTGGAGSADGINTAARFDSPQGIAIGTNGIVYVVEAATVVGGGIGRVRVIDPSAGGTVTTITLPVGALTIALNSPRGIAVHQSADVLVRDSQSPPPATTTGNSGNLSQYGDPAFMAAPDNLPSRHISGTNLFIADTGNHRIVMLMRSNATWIGYTLAGRFGVPGSDDGKDVGATFSSPSGITRDAFGNLYVTDADSHLVRQVTPRGVVHTIAGVAGVAGTGVTADQNDIGTAAKFNTPLGIVADRFGGLFVAEASANNSIRTVMPYQSRTPTNAFATFFPFNGPTNSPLMGAPPVFTTRGITESVFGLERTAMDSRDYFSGVASSAENGTNFLYAVGSAQFSANAVSANYDRMFLTKFATNGQPIWTRGHMAAASIGVVTNGGPGLTRDITAFIISSGGAGYTAAPVAVLYDPLNLNPAKRAIALTVSVAGGAVTGVTAPATPMTGPFVSPRVYVEAPQTPNMPGNGLAVAYGTNVIAAGFTNISAVALTTNNTPFLMCLETTNGTPLWANASSNSGALTSGHYNSVAVYGDKLIAVGAAYAGGGTSISNTSCLIEQWSLTGTQLVSFATNYFGVGRTSYLSQVIAIESLDRAYAVGSVLNADTTWDAFLMEIDLTALANYTLFPTNNPIVSVVTNNITNSPIGFLSTNYGKAIATDGVDLYVAVEGPGDGNKADRQAAVFRYRAKNFYLAEESLNAFVGERTWGTNMFWTTNGAGAPTNYVVTNNAWRLQVADTRAGGTNGTAQVVAWNLNFSYAATNTTALTVAAGVSNQIVLLSATPRYFRVPVPSAAGVATNLITASGPVRVTFHPASLPIDGAPGTREMFRGASTGSFLVSTNTNAVARLRPGSAYYLGIQALNPAGPVNVSLLVNFDRTALPPVITSLTDGTPVNSFIPRTAALNQFQFNVPATASAATFELLNLNGDVNLYLLRSNSPSALPSATQFDFRSANPGIIAEQIFLATNGTANSLKPGTWFLGVQNADNAPVNFTVRATARTGTPYTVVTAADAQGYNAVTTPGNAPNTVFKLTVPAGQKALLFEARNLSGAGDLVVRRGTYPVAGAVDAAGTRPGTLPELVVIRTNGTLPSLAGDWYFGVLNPGSANVGYTVMARQPTNGVLLSGTPIQILRPPGSGSLVSGQNFGFELDVVPGEKYQVQYATNLTSTNWFVLTNIVAPADGVINFLHSGALSNRNRLYYRIQVVP